MGQQGGILLNGGKLVGLPVRLRDIVKADDGRQRGSGVPQAVLGAQRQHIGSAKQRLHPGVFSNDFSGSLVASLIAAAVAEAAGHRHARRLRDESVITLAGAEVLAIFAYKANLPPASTTEQVRHQLRPLGVIAAHPVAAGEIRMTVDQGDGDLARQILFRQRQRRRAGGDDHPGDVIAQQLFKRGGELLRIVSVHQQRHKAIERQLMDQRRQQFAAKRVVETGGDDADKITAAGDHRPGDDIHLIAQGFRGAQHLLPGLLRHRGAGGEGAGDRRARDPGQSGHVLGLNPFFIAHRRFAPSVFQEADARAGVGHAHCLKRYHRKASSRSALRPMPGSGCAPPHAAKSPCRGEWRSAPAPGGGRPRSRFPHRGSTG